MTVSLVGAPVGAPTGAPVVDPAGPMAVGYIRVSTVQQGESGAGLDAQEVRVSELAVAAGVPLVHLFRDVASGSRRVGRPGLAAALAVLRPGDVLVVPKLDRLARSVWDFGDLVREVDGLGARLVIGDAPIQDMSSPAGRMFVQMLAVFADFERGMAQVRTREAVEVKRAQGRDLGGRRRGDYRVPREVRDLIVGWRGEGVSLRGIVGRLVEGGVPAGNGGRWHPHTVGVILRQEERDHGEVA